MFLRCGPSGRPQLESIAVLTEPFMELVNVAGCQGHGSRGCVESWSCNSSCTGIINLLMISVVKVAIGVRSVSADEAVGKGGTPVRWRSQRVAEACLEPHKGIRSSCTVTVWCLWELQIRALLRTRLGCPR